jgi:uncharacterized membrane protein
MVGMGRAMSALVALVLFADGGVSLLAPQKIAAQMAATGFSAERAPALGVIILICALLYAIPRTAVLGAILVTGFIGGAICTHFRIGESFSPPQIISILLGLLAWGGLYLRDSRLRVLLPTISSKNENDAKHNQQ